MLLPTAAERTAMLSHRALPTPRSGSAPEDWGEGTLSQESALWQEVHMQAGHAGCWRTLQAGVLCAVDVQHGI